MFTTVASYIDPIEAQIARGLLLAEGLDVHVGDEHLAVANWEWRLAIGGTRLRVPTAQAARAREILRAMEAGEYAIDDDAAAVINKVSAAMGPQELIALNERSVTEQLPAATIAADWLKEKGLS